MEENLAVHDGLKLYHGLSEEKRWAEALTVPDFGCSNSSPKICTCHSWKAHSKPFYPYKQFYGFLITD